MYNLWLIDPSVMMMMERAPTPSADQIAAFRADAGGVGNAGSVMVKAGDVARIDIIGVLTSTPDWIAEFFGGGNTVYGDIVAAIDSAESDPAIKSVEFFYNSPGGEAQPVAALGDRIAAMKKPTTARIVTAASAAYWLASQADSLIADGVASTVGSIGVVVSMIKPSVSPYIDVTSENAPNKRPDPETAEGKAAIQGLLNQMEDLFVTAVAVGRDTTVDDVHNNFGKGGLLLAKQALDAGMIDSIATQKPTVSIQTVDTGDSKMDLEKLKAEHPGLFNQVFAQGKEAGSKEEADRVKFHLTMGKNMNAHAIAIDACLTGKAKDDGETTALYLDAGVKKRALDDRSADENDVTLTKGKGPEGEEGRQAAQAKAIFSFVQ